MREDWFAERINKTVYRNKTTCKCRVCRHVYENGLHINDKIHAMYVAEMEDLSNLEGIPLKYFDTIEERDENTIKR